MAAFSGDDVPARTSGKAVASLVLGILSFGLTCLAGVPAVILGIIGLGEVNRSRERLGGRGLAVSGIVLGVVGTLVSGVALLGLSLWPATSRLRESTDRVQSANNLKQIAVALQNYHDARGRLPPAVLQGSGGQPYSWRVAVLPYLGQENLYQTYNRREPWDSPGNLASFQQFPR